MKTVNASINGVLSPLVANERVRVRFTFRPDRPPSAPSLARRGTFSTAPFARIIATGQTGFSLIEALVALLIFSIVSAGLAETLVAAQTIRRTSALRMEANQLAVAEAERARAGDPTAGTITIGAFSCATSVEALPAYPDLARVRVSVDWMDRTPQRLELVTLLSSRNDDE